MKALRKQTRLYITVSMYFFVGSNSDERFISSSVRTQEERS